MTSLFDKELLRMEQELLALKTIHDRGLGTTRFYTYERSIEIPSGIHYWILTATVEDTSLLPMVALPFVEGPTTSNYQFDFTDDGFVVSTLASEGTVTVKIVTSTALADIQMEIREW